MTPEMAPEAPTVGTGDAGLHEHVRPRRHEPAQQIEDEEAPGPHAVLDVVPEHPEEQHVAEQVPPAAVQEHRE